MLRVQLFIVLMCGGLMAMSVVMGLFYAQTRVRHVLPNENPQTDGWFKDYDWWRTSFLVVLAIPPIFAGMACLVFINVKFVKLLFLLYLVVTILWWTGVVITDIVLMTRANDPTQPDNPASSFNRCCTPQFYTTVPYCNGPALPAFCGPVPWSLNDLGINSLYIFSFIWECIYLGMWGAFIILVARLVQLMDKYNQTGDDNYVKETLAETGTPYIRSKHPGGAPMLKQK